MVFSFSGCLPSTPHLRLSVDLSSERGTDKGEGTPTANSSIDYGKENSLSKSQPRHTSKKVKPSPLPHQCLNTQNINNKPPEKKKKNFF
jgi:hypothetical protein